MDTGIKHKIGVGGEWGLPGRGIKNRYNKPKNVFFIYMAPNSFWQNYQKPSELSVTTKGQNIKNDPAPQ